MKETPGTTRRRIMTDDNLTLLTDFYELTMMQGYHRTVLAARTAVFDLYYRKNPSGNGYAIVAGLAQIIDYIKGLRFDSSDIRYLKRLNRFSDAFLDDLRQFRFTGEIYAVPEGTVVFPNEPLLRVKAPVNIVQRLIVEILYHHGSGTGKKITKVIR